MLHVHRVERLEELACLQASWNALLRPDEAHAVFLSHQWATHWLDAYGQGRSPYVLVASQGGSARGILPLVSGRDRVAGLPVRCLDLLANGHSPAADLIAAPGWEARVADAFAHHLVDIDPDWDVSTWREVPATARLVELHRRFPVHSRQAVVQRTSPYVAISGTWDAYRARLSKNFQRALRNNRNRIARAGTADIELLVEPNAIDGAMADVFAIGERSWQGKAGSAVGSTAENRAFYAGLWRVFEPGALRLWFLRLAGQRVAFELHVRHAGVEFGLKTGFDLGFEDVGAGTFLDQSIVEQLFAEGAVREYDLLGNADAYKLRWTSNTREYQRLTVFGASAPARVGSLWTLRVKPMLRSARGLARFAPVIAALAGGARRLP